MTDLENKLTFAAHAQRVNINVTTDGRTIDVIVHDDGIGGASESEQGGIDGMRRRVEELGGRLELRMRASNAPRPQIMGPGARPPAGI